MPSVGAKRAEQRARYYQRYRDLCAKFGEPRRGGPNWHPHYRQLREREALASDRRLTKEEHFAYWRERLTDDQIQAIGGGIA